MKDTKILHSMVTWQKLFYKIIWNAKQPLNVAIWDSPKLRIEIVEKKMLSHGTTKFQILFLTYLDEVPLTKASDNPPTPEGSKPSSF